MLWTIVITLLVLWALGLLFSFTLGGMVHVLVIVAGIVLLVRLFQTHPGRGGRFRSM